MTILGNETILGISTVHFEGKKLSRRLNWLNFYDRCPPLAMVIEYNKILHFGP
jgi:hypothetical protein